MVLKRAIGLSRLACAAVALLSTSVGTTVVGADKDCKDCESPLVRVSARRNANYAGGPTKKARAFSAKATMKSVASRFKLLGGEGVESVVPKMARSLVSPELASAVYSNALSDEGGASRQRGASATSVESHGKLFVNQVLAFKGIPLSKHCNALTILGRDGNPVAVRQRNVPTRFDGSDADVTSKKAIQYVKDWIEKNHESIGLPEEELNNLEPGEPDLEIYADGKSGKLCWKILVTSVQPLMPFSW